MKIYLAHPISGLGFDEVVTYYEDLRGRLTARGYDVLQPMTGKGYLRTEICFRGLGDGHPQSTNHAIVERDNWMVHQADVVLVDLTGAKAVSIGCMMELAWSHELRRHTIVVLTEENVHWHAFVLECADIVLASLAEAVEYLTKLALQQT